MDTEAKWEIDSAVLAMLSQVPTIDGYTSGYPIGYPFPTRSNLATRSDDAIKWAQRQGFEGRICQVSDDGRVSVTPAWR
jgi:hypothetical protein